MGRKKAEDDADLKRLRLRERQRKNQQKCMEKKRDTVAKLEAEMNEIKQRITRSLNQFDILKTQTSDLIAEVRSHPGTPEAHHYVNSVENNINQMNCLAEESKKKIVPETTTTTPPNTRKSTRTKAVDQSVPADE